MKYKTQFLSASAPGLTLTALAAQIAVRSQGLNFKDVLNVLGMYPGDPGPPGLDCAGVVTAVGEGALAQHCGTSVVSALLQLSLCKGCENPTADSVNGNCKPSIPLLLESCW